ncbi:MAG: DUF3592 domain-containing protein [Myxococcales bacterium]|nr:DUF3592 domain-containing protein [Myxococcales bacterium]MCB9753536.1 DUF3592 domain-containing protein [Myxococcales bacterium]
MASQRAGIVGPLLFGLIFMLVGVLGAYATIGDTLTRRAEARRYVAGECTVTGTEIERYQDSEGDTMYRPRVRYVHVVDGQEFHGDRIGFSSFGTSIRSYSEGVLLHYPVGARVTCFFDPAAPEQLVLDKSMSWSILFALIPLAFASVGLGIIIQTLKARGTPKGALPSRKAWRARLEQDGELVLEPRESASFMALFIGGFALAFGGAGVGIAQAAWVSRSVGVWLMALVFLGVGFVMSWWFLWSLLQWMGPRVKLTLDRPTVPLGESVSLRWRVQSWTPLNSVQLELVGQEESTYTRGTDTITDAEVFHRAELAAVPGDGRVMEGRARVELPRDTMHSFHGAHNRVVWLIKLEVDVDWWPDIEQEYEIGVEPWRRKARR